MGTCGPRALTAATFSIGPAGKGRPGQLADLTRQIAVYRVESVGEPGRNRVGRQDAASL